MDLLAGKEEIIWKLLGQSVVLVPYLSQKPKKIKRFWKNSTLELISLHQNEVDISHQCLQDNLRISKRRFIWKKIEPYVNYLTVSVFESTTLFLIHFNTPTDFIMYSVLVTGYVSSIKDATENLLVLDEESIETFLSLSLALVSWQSGIRKSANVSAFSPLWNSCLSVITGWILCSRISTEKQHLWLTFPLLHFWSAPLHWNSIVEFFQKAHEKIQSLHPWDFQTLVSLKLQAALVPSKLQSKNFIMW